MLPPEKAPANCCMPSRAPEAKAPVLPIASPQQPAPTLPLVPLPGGTFLMGEDRPEIAKYNDGEGPLRPTTLAPFAISPTAVTNAEFAAFVAATNYVTEAESFGWSYVFHRHLTDKAKRAVRGAAGPAQWWIGVDGASWKHPEGPGSNIKKREDHPVTHISWHDASAFCAWSGTRLPTEAEWEFAARGGLERKIFPWGDELVPKGKNGKPEHRMNVWQGKFPDLDTAADGFAGTAPVKSFAPNGFGLYNMTGNVWEWCNDWFSLRHGAELENPTGPGAGTLKVIRGGSFLCHVSYCNRYRCAARTANTPDSTTGHCGFRVARSL